MSALPLSIIIDVDADKIVEWSRKKAELIHDLSLEGIKNFLDNDDKDVIVLVKFFEECESTYSFADITMHREDIEESLQIAEDFYVENELYEKAAIARNLRQQMNIN
jgi:hypothetical protein